jgi:hypothetical protein
MIINQQEALETGPISGVSITKALRGQAATLDRLRGDRQLDEALTRGPDPLHLVWQQRGAGRGRPQSPSARSARS